jgi:3-oxoacyl-[acyl-carrier protein] reductase
MLERGGGKIVNVSTLATEVPPPGQLKYVLAKSALDGLTRALAAEYANKNIQVNSVVPNFVETDLVAHVTEGFRKKIADEIPMGRLTSPVDVARAVLFLASNQSSYTTGQRLAVTGGAPPFL